MNENTPKVRKTKVFLTATQKRDFRKAVMNGEPLLMAAERFDICQGTAYRLLKRTRLATIRKPVKRSDALHDIALACSKSLAETLRLKKPLKEALDGETI